MNINFLKGRSYQLISILIIPTCWFLLADVFEVFTPVLLPPLSTILLKLNKLLVSGSLFADLSATFYRWFLGLFFGVLLGVFAGLLLGVSSRLRQIFEFPIEFLRAMPVTAIFPLFLIIYGIGDPSKIAMAFTPTFLLMLINTSYGVSLADPTRRRMATVFGASRFQIFRWIVSMDALPQIFIGLRLALAQSLVVTVVSEMFIGSDFGLGQKVYDSYLTNSVSTLYALLIILGLIGYTANKILLLVEAKVIFWTGK